MVLGVVVHRVPTMVQVDAVVMVVHHRPVVVLA
jgi:hypothetical protein